MTKEEILDYVMNTPENTNRMVLSDMLDEFSSGSGGGGGGSALLITATYDSDTEMITLNKTFAEISTALAAGQLCLVHNLESVGSIYVGYYIVANVLTGGYGDGTVGILSNDSGNPRYVNFDADAPDVYPSKYLGD